MLSVVENFVGVGLDMRKLQSRFFGIYLIVISVAQLSLYGYLFSGIAENLDSLQYSAFDPRFFWSMIEHSIRRADPNAPTFVGFFSAVWIFALGITFVLRRLPFTAYIGSELILGAPQLIVALPWGFVLLFSERGGEGILTSFAPPILAFFFTLVPMIWVIVLAVYIEPRVDDVP